MGRHILLGHSTRQTRTTPVGFRAPGLLPRHSVPGTEPEIASLSRQLNELTQDLARLIKAEIALAKSELSAAAGGIAAVAGAFAGAAICVALLAGFLFTALVLALQRWVEPWVATLTVGVVLLLMAAILMILGRKKSRAADLLPRHALASVREDVSSLRRDVERVRGEH